MDIITKEGRNFKIESDAYIAKEQASKLRENLKVIYFY